MKKKVILKVEEINKSFGPTKAVVNFSIEIKEGEIRGLIGENGSGKSTFSSMLAGIQKRDNGVIYVDGKEYNPNSTNDAAACGVALVVQEIGTIGSTSVAENIFINKEKMFLKNHMINYKDMYKEASIILNKIGGSHIDPNMTVRSLNLEDRKLVEIARAMYINPKLLIIDETSNALSKNGREVLYKNINKVKENKGSVLFITHDLNELIEVCDSVTVMRDGAYIKTLNKEEMLPKILKELMVGREIAENYYRPDFKPTYEEEVVLTAKNVCTAEVNNISLELHRGEILGIGGLADCGMHSLGRILFGLDTLDSGEVMINKSGKIIKNPRQAIRSEVGYLSKNRDTEALILQYSILDNICLPTLKKLKKRGLITPKSETELADKWGKELSIKMNSTKQFCTELSGGNKQKVVLAKWLGNNSKILIMDCPTRGIDIGVKEVIYKLMMKFKEEGRSVIMISEELTELIGMSDRIIIMKNYGVSKVIMRSENVSEHELIEYMV